MKRKGLSVDELFELQVETSGYVDANEVIKRARQINTIEELWLDEVDYFDELFYPSQLPTPARYIAKHLWMTILGVVYDEKDKLISCAQNIITAFGGGGEITDVTYDEKVQRLIWKVKFLVD